MLANYSSFESPLIDDSEYFIAWNKCLSCILNSEYRESSTQLNSEYRESSTQLNSEYRESSTQLNSEYRESSTQLTQKLCGQIFVQLVCFGLPLNKGNKSTSEFIAFQSPILRILIRVLLFDFSLIRVHASPNSFYGHCNSFSSTLPFLWELKIQK